MKKKWRIRVRKEKRRKCELKAEKVCLARSRPSQWLVGPRGSSGRLSFLIGCSTLVSRVVDRRCEISPVQLFFLPSFLSVRVSMTVSVQRHAWRAAATQVLARLDMTRRRGHQPTLPRGSQTLSPLGKKEKVNSFCTFFVVIRLSPPYLWAGNIAASNLHGAFSVHIYIVGEAPRGRRHQGTAAQDQTGDDDDEEEKEDFSSFFGYITMIIMIMIIMVILIILMIIIIIVTIHISYNYI